MSKQVTIATIMSAVTVAIITLQVAVIGVADAAVSVTLPALHASTAIRMQCIAPGKPDTIQSLINIVSTLQDVVMPATNATIPCPSGTTDAIIAAAGSTTNAKPALYLTSCPATASSESQATCRSACASRLSLKKGSSSTKLSRSCGVGSIVSTNILSDVSSSSLAVAPFFHEEAPPTRFVQQVHYTGPECAPGTAYRIDMFPVWDTPTVIELNTTTSPASYYVVSNIANTTSYIQITHKVCADARNGPCNETPISKGMLPMKCESTMAGKQSRVVTGVYASNFQAGIKAKWGQFATKSTQEPHPIVRFAAIIIAIVMFGIIAYAVYMCSMMHVNKLEKDATSSWPHAGSPVSRNPVTTDALELRTDAFVWSPTAINAGAGSPRRMPLSPIVVRKHASQVVIKVTEGPHEKSPLGTTMASIERSSALEPSEKNGQSEPAGQPKPADQPVPNGQKKRSDLQVQLDQPKSSGLRKLSDLQVQIEQAKQVDQLKPSKQPKPNEQRKHSTLQVQIEQPTTAELQIQIEQPKPAYQPNKTGNVQPYVIN